MQAGSNRRPFTAPETSSLSLLFLHVNIFSSFFVCFLFPVKACGKQTLRTDMAEIPTRESSGKAQNCRFTVVCPQRLENTSLYPLATTTSLLSVGAASAQGICHFSLAAWKGFTFILAALMTSGLHLSWGILPGTQRVLPLRGFMYSSKLENSSHDFSVLFF